jgi:NSS family neurotransmitter:Na+ symporter
MLAGTAIFSIVFAMGADPAEGPGLIFVVLPTIFPQISGGLIWGTLFFFILFMAALTSAISILEVVTAYFIDEKGWSRQRATISFGIVITIVGMFCSLSMGSFTDFKTIFNKSFMDFMDELSSVYMLPIGGALTSLFILYKWKVDNFVKELNEGTNSLISRIGQINTISFALFLLSAGVVGIIVINSLADLFLGISLSHLMGF